MACSSLYDKEKAAAASAGAGCTGIAMKTDSVDSVLLYRFTAAGNTPLDSFSIMPN